MTTTRSLPTSSNGHVHELDRIHRFTEPWEAAASLKLRRGDPRTLDDYLDPSWDKARVARCLARNAGVRA